MNPEDSYASGTTDDISYQWCTYAQPMWILANGLEVEEGLNSEFERLIKDGVVFEVKLGFRYWESEDDTVVTSGMDSDVIYIQMAEPADMPE